MPAFSAQLLADALAGLPASARLLIAYSGGVDSHVLLHACAALGERLAGGRLLAVHLDHGLHPDSAAWAEHCGAVCTGLGVALITQRLALRPARGESLEAVARDARYAALAALIGPGDWLATAQHQDDQAETLLLALLRGSGVHGLAAMPRRAMLGAGVLIRPLLDVERAALLTYARAHGLHWLEDPSNADTDRDRNLLRSRVLPLLRARWPAASRTLARSAGHCAEAAGLINGLADGLLSGLAGRGSGAVAARPGGVPAVASGDREAALSAGCGPATLSVAGLRALPPAEARAVLRRWVELGGFLPPPADRLRRVQGELLTARADRRPLVVWGGCELRRYRDALFALAPLPAAPPPAPMPWAPPAPHALPEGLGRLIWSAPDPSAPVDLAVGFARPGFGALRLHGTRRTLTEAFQAAGIPPWLRPLVPLLFAGAQLIGPVGVTLAPGLPVTWAGHPWGRLGLFAPVTTSQ